MPSQLTAPPISRLLFPPSAAPQELLDELQKLEIKVSSLDTPLTDKNIDQMMPELGFAWVARGRGAGVWGVRG
jgi:hypothetical protein